MVYRDKNIVAFLFQEQGFNILFWMQVFLVFLFSGVFYIANYKMTASWSDPTWFILIPVIVLLWIVGVPTIANYGMYLQGARKLHAKDLLIEKVKTNIQGFDLFKKRNYFDFNLSTPIYTFQYADLIIDETRIVVLGYGEAAFMRKSFAAPFVIPISSLGAGSDKSKKTVDLHNIRFSSEHVQVEFADRVYEKPLKITFKNIREQIEPYVSRSFEIKKH